MLYIYCSNILTVNIYSSYVLYTYILSHDIDDGGLSQTDCMFRSGVNADSVDQ